MGWKDSHLFEFILFNKKTAKSYFENVKEKLGIIFSKGFTSAKYIYDFGDRWIHRVELEEIFSPKGNFFFPRCIDGAGLCPPEDCGGIGKYKKMFIFFQSKPKLPSTTQKVFKKQNTAKDRFKFWRKHFERNPFSLRRVKFRTVPTLDKETILSKRIKWVHSASLGYHNLNDFYVEIMGSNLSFPDVEKLYQTLLNGTFSQRKRAICLLAYLKEIPKRKILEAFCFSEKVFKKLILRYRKSGVESIFAKKREGLLKFEDPKYIQMVFKILHSPPSAYGFNRTSWKQDDVIKVLSSQNLKVSKGNLSKLVKKAGFNYRKAVSVLTSNDPKYREKVDEIKKILGSLGEREKFFSVDEFGPFAVKMQGGKSLVKNNTIKTVPQFQKAKGTVLLTGALELSTNQMIHFYSKKKNTEEMIKLLNLLVHQYSDQECIYFSWDAASWHGSKKLNAEVEKINSSNFKKQIKSPIVKLAPLPSCAQFLNVIESVFSGMAKAIIHNSNYESEDECKQAIDRYFMDRNQYFLLNPKRAGGKIWGKERVEAIFNESNNCKDPDYR